MTVTTRSKARKSPATIKSLPPEVVILLIEILKIDDALELCDALQWPEQVAVQYCAIDDEDDIDDILYNINLKPHFYKFVLKNKRFQIKASTNEKTRAALKTFDLEFLEKSLEKVKPDPNRALLMSAFIGFTDAVKLLLSDPRVDPSAFDNRALIYATGNGHTEVVKLLLSDSRVDPSAENNLALIEAVRYGYFEISKLIFDDSRVDPSVFDNYALIYAAQKGHTEIVKLLLSDSRVDPSARNNLALIEAVRYGNLEIAQLIVNDPRVDHFGN